jgi:uncharacterized integral membrane protein
MAFIKWILALPLIIGAVLFAMAHAQTVTVTWNPLKPEMELPLYVVTFLFLGIGILIGMLLAWISMSNVRKERRQLKKENKQLERDINATNEKLIEELANKKSQNVPEVIEHAS